MADKEKDTALIARERNGKKYNRCNGDKKKSITNQSWNLRFVTLIKINLTKRALDQISE
ncbi:hypothetical protein ACUMKS_002401 [Proteus mirabilis]|uniref:hypothetical protein n=1 Tax=Proteus TaxID=583 RepID=UPI0014851B61|nr:MULTISPECIES: hypothetical protein [Proteus]MDM3788429.1 hypothetical protein [Proteus mirabilis]HCZ8647453.1 hypothetical protein [Proteus mirabilis]